MKPIQLQVAITLDDGALGTLAEVLAQAIERGTARHMQAAMVKLGEGRAEQGKPLPPPVPVSPTVTPSRTTEPESQKEHAALIDVKEVARLLNISPGTVYRLNDSGKMPRVIRIGSLVRWNRAQIEAWVAEGCPAVERRGVRRT